MKLKILHYSLVLLACYTANTMPMEQNLKPSKNEKNYFDSVPIEIQKLIGIKLYKKHFKERINSYFVDNQNGYIQTGNYSYFELCIPLYYKKIKYKYQTQEEQNDIYNYAENIVSLAERVTVNGNNAIVLINKVQIPDVDYQIWQKCDDKTVARYLTIHSNKPINIISMEIPLDEAIRAIGCSKDGRWIIYQTNDRKLKLFKFNKKNKWVLLGSTTVKKHLTHLHIVEDFFILTQCVFRTITIVSLADLFKGFHKKTAPNWLQLFFKEYGICKSLQQL